MSLFQVNEWWKCSRTQPEECGAGCLCVANIDNAADNLDKIILGSYNGILHIYSPSKDSGGIHDSLLESNLQSPILQILVGRFVPVNTNIHLAVLHPQLLTVYKFTVAAKKQESEMKMEKIYQHKLERLAANMVCGPFGGVKDRDFICVQSLDGALSVFEQETFAFTRFLPGFLLPGPLAYTAHSDSFITASSSYILESFSYQVLAVATDAADADKTKQSGAQGGKRIEADWTFNLGEYAMEIEVVEFPEKKPQMVVLGEHSLFCLDTAGKLEFVKKFEDTLSCVKSFPSPNRFRLMTIACTHSRQLLVFEGAFMKWAAKLDDVPVVAKIGQFGGFSGMMVFTTDQCQVSCHYLGTSPTMFTLPRSKQREMPHDYVDKELQQTKKLITDHLAASGDELRGQKIKSDLKVSLQVPKSIDKTSVATKKSGGIGMELPSFTIQINLKVSRRINEVQVSIPVHKPLVSTLSNICYPMLLDQDPPLSIRASFFLDERFPPSTLDHKVLVYYQQISGIPQIVSLDFRLPLSLVAHPCPPEKKMDYRITLDSNKPCVNLMELFPAFSSEHGGPTCVGFSYMNGIKGTILTAKSSNRYRIQCEEFYGLWLMTDELIHRLRARHSDIHVTSQDPPNLEDYVLLIDEHFKIRKAAIEMRALLQQRALQYRSIQKRLLTRFKDKTPQPLNGLDTLLLGTHTQIIALADAIEDNEELLRQCCVKLSSATRLIALLPSLWRHLSREDVIQLESALAADMTYNESNSVGWEEMVDSSLTALLKTTLSRNDSGGHPFSVPPSALEIPQDTVKLKKHLAIVMDRLSKGGKLTGGKESVSSGRASRISDISQDIHASGNDNQRSGPASPGKLSPLPSAGPTGKLSSKLSSAPSLSEDAEDLLNGSTFDRSLKLVRNKDDKQEIETYFDDEDLADILS